MAPTRSPRLRLEHMRDAIAAVRRLTRGTTLAEVRRDEIRRAALERFLEIISEASRHIPEAMRQGFPEIPWRAVAALGNRLRHEYQEIKVDMLWHIATTDLDDLERAVATMLRDLGEDAGDGQP